jgi:iron(III) transport system substrate-binding protein
MIAAAPNHRVRAEESRRMKCARFSNLWCTGMLLVAFFLHQSMVFGQTASLDQARKEGEVVLYSTITVSAFDLLNRTLKEKYPFLNVRHIRLGPSQQLARIIQEYRASQFQVDVVYNNLLHLLYLKDAGVLGKYESPESKFMMKEAIDPDSCWIGGDIDILVTGFNAKMISRNEVPVSYDKYLESKYKGQMAINTNNPYGLVGMVSLRGEEQAIGYLKRLAQQSLRPVQGFTHMTNLMAAGEYPLALFGQVTKFEEMKEKGAPVDWLPGSPSFSTVGAYAVTRNAPHPAAARLLVDFFLSAQGQDMLSRTGKLPMRRGVSSHSKNIDRLLESGSLHTIKLARGFDKYAKIYRELIELR